MTGASGFVGRRTVPLLLAAGHEVVSISRAPSDHPAHTRLTHVVADLLEHGATRRLIADHRPTHLLHFAWYVEPGKFWSALENIDWAAASLTLLRAFLEGGGQGAVLAGTCAEYDWSLGGGTLLETSPVAPATFYGQIKDALRRAAVAMGDRYGAPVGWGRLFWLYGPGEARGRLVSDVAYALAHGKAVETGEGLQKRDFIHVNDAATAFVAALEAGLSGPFNVGSGDAVPVRDLVRILGDVSGRPDLIRWGARPAPVNEPAMLEADITRLRLESGFTPAIGLAEGLSETYRTRVRSDQ